MKAAHLGLAGVMGTIITATVLLFTPPVGHTLQSEVTTTPLAVMSVGLRLYIDQNTLTLYVDETPTERACLFGLRLRVADYNGLLGVIGNDFEALRQAGYMAQPGSCFIYRLDNTSSPDQSVCTAPQIFRRLVTQADVFWHNQNMLRSIQILGGNVVPSDICSNDPSSPCSFTFTPTTPCIFPTPPVTSTRNIPNINRLVTNGDFQQFVAAVTRPDGSYDPDADCWSEQADNWLQARPTPIHPRDMTVTEPRRYVTWYEADAYCHWIGGRLLSQTEWVAAAAQGIFTETGILYEWAITNNTTPLIMQRTYDSQTGVPTIIPNQCTPDGPIWVGRAYFRCTQ